MPKDEANVASDAISSPARELPFAQRVFYASLIFVAVVALAALVWQVAHYLLLFFGGVLLAILLDAIATGIGRVAPLPRTVHLLAAILVVLAVVAAIALVIPSVVAQTPELARYFDNWLEWIRQTLGDIEPLRQALQSSDSGELARLLPSPAGVLGGAAQIIGGIVSFLTGTVLIIVFGLYLSADPARYYEGSLSVCSPGLREKLRQTGADLGMVLRRWLVGKILMMLIIGLSSYVVLTFLGVPLALLLSFIAGLTAFIPYIGPLIGGSAMILVAVTKDLSLGLIVFGFYLVLQLMESYLLTPMIQSRAIFVPPAIVILAQVIFGVLFGVLGIALATPLAAVADVLFHRLYLGEPVDAD